MHRLKQISPYMIGLAVGAVGASWFGLQANWLHTSEDVTRRIHDAKISAYASICESDVLQRLRELDKERAFVGGWTNPDRHRLATKFAPVTSSMSDLDHDEVIRRCEALLRRDA